MNVYDLTPSNEYLYGLGLGFYHSGLVVYGKEWTFGSGGGIFSTAPKEVPNAPFRETVVLGSTRLGPSDVDRVIDALRDAFQDGSYNLYKKNCNHFAEALASKLLNRSLPGWVNRMATLGQMFSCLMPDDDAMGQAPVGEGGGGSSGGSGGSRFHATSSSSGVAMVPRSGRGSASGAPGRPSPFAGKPVRAGGAGGAAGGGTGASGRPAADGGMLGGMLGSVFGSGGSSASASGKEGAGSGSGGAG